MTMKAGTAPSHSMRLASMSMVPRTLSLKMDLLSFLSPMSRIGQLEHEFDHIVSQTIPFSTLGTIFLIRSLKYRIS